MSKIEEMIKELCPKGVEKVKLGDVCNISRGKRVVRKDLETVGKIPVFQNSLVPLGYYSKSNCPAETTFVISAGAAGVIGISDTPFWAADDCFIVESTQMEDKFIYNFLKTKEYYLQSKIRGGAIKRLAKEPLEALEIPLPPLAIQQEIVSVLDSFTTLIDKMKKEVELRKKQMEVYREKLMSPQKDWEVKNLGEIGKFTKGTGLLKSDFRETGFPCIHYGQIHTIYNTRTYITKSFCEDSYAQKLRKAKNGDLLIATTSEDVEACCKATVWLGDGEVAYSGDSHCFSHNQNPEYVAYLFQTEMFAKQKRMAATGAKVVRVSGESMATFTFSFPPLPIQQEIVRTLDTFESYISKLEKLIALRQKQYEYYREKLLTFE